jgi:general secretion pathway protein I
MSADLRRGGGFTLLEVVVALAIAGLALVGMFQAGSTGLVSADIAARAEEAVERAQSHLAAIGRDAALTAGQFTDDDGGGYRWRLSVRPVASRRMPGPDGGSTTSTALYAVEVEISWRDAGRQRSVVLKSLRLGTAAGNG